jgi:hypothetical protein
LGAALLYLSLLFPAAGFQRRTCDWLRPEHFQLLERQTPRRSSPLKVKTRTIVRASFFCFLALAVGPEPAEPSAHCAAARGFTFPQKQTLIYSVDWRVFPAGTAVLHFEASEDQRAVTANADTLGAINLLFHVSDHFQSTFDRGKGCTYEFDKQTVEGRRQINSTLKLDLRTQKSIIGREEPGDGADQACGRPRCPAA